MGLFLRSKAKALPILYRDGFSLRSILSDLFSISEPPCGNIMTASAALDRLSDTELHRHMRPEQITAASIADRYIATRRAQSSEYVWRHRNGYLCLLVKSKLAKSRGVPGVVFEFMIRTDASTWIVYRVPELNDICEISVYSERNELLVYSKRPPKLSISPEIRSYHDRPYRLGQVLDRIAASLFA